MKSAKPMHSGARIQAMVKARLLAQPEVQRRIAEGVHLAPLVGPVEAHARDARGRNWDVALLERGEGLERTFRAIVDGLREAIDLA